MARLNYPGTVHHLIWRFVDRHYFFDSDELRNQYLWFLGRALVDSDWRCIAYALMSNHIHIAAIAGREPLAVWSRRVNTPFAQVINERNARFGPVFANRANDRVIDPRAVARVIAYIHNNPVRAALVARARDSSWTSHNAYLHPAMRPLWLDRAAGLALSGFEDSASFDRFVDTHPTEPGEPNVAIIARAARRFGLINPATPFARQVPLVMRPFARIRVDPRRVVELVAQHFDLAEGDMVLRVRQPQIRIARTTAVHCGLAVGLTGADMAAVLCISQQSVSRMTRYAQRSARDCEEICEQLLLEFRAREMDP